MAISNCLFSATSVNPRGFTVWCVLAKLITKIRNKPYTITLATIKRTNENKTVHYYNYISNFIN